jgi:hypothetical protein
LTQARKKKVLEEVRKQRKRRTIISVIVVVILVGTIGYGVYALTQNRGESWPFPCGAEGTTVHVHPWLQIFINTGTGNFSVTVPANIGFVSQTCLEPMHTHDASGIIHIEATSVSNQYTLGAFFTIWRLSYPSGISVNGLNRPVILNSTDIFGFKTGQGHTLSLLIDRGQPTYRNSTVDESLDLVHYDYCTAQSTGPPCSPTAGGDPQYPGGYPYNTGHTIIIVYS